MCDWILAHVGDEVPLHSSAFHPDFQFNDREATPIETLLRAYELAQNAGIKHVYVGNVNDVAHQSTYYPNCHQRVIERDWYQLGRYDLQGNQCGHCGHELAGHYQAQPGNWEDNESLWKSRDTAANRRTSLRFPALRFPASRFRITPRVEKPK